MKKFLIILLIVIVIALVGAPFLIDKIASDSQDKLNSLQDNFDDYFYEDPGFEEPMITDGNISLDTVLLTLETNGI